MEDDNYNKHRGEKSGATRPHLVWQKPLWKTMKNQC